LLRKADTGYTVEFWTTKKSAHGGFRHWFEELLGSIGVAVLGVEASRNRYYKVEGKSGREAHKRNVLGPFLFQQCTGVVCLASAP